MKLLLSVVLMSLSAEPSTRPTWPGLGAYRLLVQVEATAMSPGRNSDEGPAEVAIDFDKCLADIAPGRQADLTTLQVIRLDPTSDKTPTPSRFAYGRSPADVPWRWYDATIDYDFPEFEDNISATDGKLNYRRYTRFGYFYDVVGDWKAGRLVFAHAQESQRPTRYAITFDLLPAGATPQTAEPRGWIGDGLHRCEPVSESSTGLIHTRIDRVDWNGDGLFDLIVGCARGGMVWFPNLGKAGEPNFAFSRLIKTDDNLPLDVGWSASPHAVDWDGDGRIDVIAGGEMNRVVFYRNTGTAQRPVLHYEGLIRTDDGKPLMLPWEPSPETEKFYKYTQDYYPVLTTVDWDGDGDLDLLAGGYVTGRIYLFENLAGKGKLPRLRMVGPVEADGQPIDVGWCAAPTLGDLDGDGDLDLISGSMPMTAGGGDSASSEKFLYYFRNDGSRFAPRFRKVPFPCKGTFPAAALGTPRLIDWNSDGRLDLIVSAGTQIYFFRNIGTAREPLFEAHRNPLSSRWGSTCLPGRRLVEPATPRAPVENCADTSRGIASGIQLIDWDGDGRLDLVTAPYVFRNTGLGNPGVYERPFCLLKKGQEISHLSGIGDDWRFQQVVDLDGDGTFDLMDADHAGHFWFHRNRGTNASPDFDTKGLRLMLGNGRPVSVGEGMEGFDALQGARATYAVGDYNGDRLPDLVAVNATGFVRWFKQIPPPPDTREPRFEPAVEIARLSTRGAASACDWNGDAKLDAVVGSSAAEVYVVLGRGGAPGAPFDAPRRLALPNAPYGSGAPVAVGDFNGDGDPDIILSTAYGYHCFYEHSFVERGYAKGQVVGAEKRR